MRKLISDDDRELRAKLWAVCERLLHTDHYKTTYASWLSDCLLSAGDQSQCIVDTAAGVGFPSIQLCRKGFANVWCCDGDADLLRRTIADAAELEHIIPVLCTRWQELPKIIMNQFDSVLCLDASIGFMDSWDNDAMVSGSDNVENRVKEVLRNFFDITRPGGRFLVGLQKNNNRSNMNRYVMDVGVAVLDGHEATATWDMRYDWQARRKVWTNKVIYLGRAYEQTCCSYLFDKHELMSFLTEIGFSAAREVETPDFFYEDVIVATRFGT